MKRYQIQLRAGVIIFVTAIVLLIFSQYYNWQLMLQLGFNPDRNMKLLGVTQIITIVLIPFLLITSTILLRSGRKNQKHQHTHEKRLDKYEALNIMAKTMLLMAAVLILPFLYDFTGPRFSFYYIMQITQAIPILLIVSACLSLTSWKLKPKKHRIDNYF